MRICPFMSKGVSLFARKFWYLLKKLNVMTILPLKNNLYFTIARLILKISALSLAVTKILKVNGEFSDQ